MQFPGCRRIPTLVVVALLATAPLDATTVMQLNLAEMSQRADMIYRGTVLSESSGTVTAGGGQLPVVTYRLRVDELFRGDVETVKDVRIAELRMIGKRAPVHDGAVRSVSVLPQMPQLEVGRTYLLFTTRPSAIGLSTTVGLGQGAFSISRVGKDETAVNEVNNSGLFRDMSVAPATARVATTSAASSGGPIPYDELAAQIRALVGSEEGR